MTQQPILVTFAIVAFAAGIGCSSSPGRPGKNSEVVPPNQIMDFKLLYSQNCAGCHGVEGKGGAATALANPVFLAIADDGVIRPNAAKGAPGTPIAALAPNAGARL